MDMLDTQRAIENGDEDLLEATCQNCGRFVDDDGMTIDPRGCCFFCKAD
jgi:hypothetical protein